MTIHQLEKNGTHLAWVSEKELLITDVQSALDLAATAKYETGCTSMILDKASICGEFFILSTGLAGEISSEPVSMAPGEPCQPGNMFLECLSLFSEREEHSVTAFFLYFSVMIWLTFYFLSSSSQGIFLPIDLFQFPPFIPINPACI